MAIDKQDLENLFKNDFTLGIQKVDTNVLVEGLFDIVYCKTRKGRKD